MGYRNNQVGYPKSVLSSNAIVKKNNFAILPFDGLVRNQVPGFKNCDMTILSSPKLGASFVDYYVTIKKDGGNDVGFGGDGVETFVYVISGELKIKADKEEFDLTQGGYMYCPPSKKMYFSNVKDENAELFLYKRRYKKIDGYDEPYVVCKNIKDLTPYNYEGMENVLVTDFLPTDNLSFDMNFHILSFTAGGSHGYVETHVQEHGAYIFSGEGVYNLDNNWIPVKKNDYIFMASYSLQAAYGVSTKEPFAYIYSKDCNRDEII